MEFLTDIKQARALGHEYQVIDIYSNSWGLKDDGITLQYLRECTAKTLEKAAKEVVIYQVIYHNVCYTML